MEAKVDRDQLIAQTLTADGAPRGQGKPLAYRRHPDGSLVVIAADGRKLWFSAAEVARVEARLDEAAEATIITHSRVPVKLVSPPREPLRQNNGIPLSAVIYKESGQNHDKPK